MRLTVGSLFAGIGGFDLGFERAGFDVKWQVEIDPFCRAVLAKHWPDVRRYEDVKECCTGTLRVSREDGRCAECGRRDYLQSVDVLCGGFPCQDISEAGHGVGIEHGEQSGLWREMVRLVRELRPRYVIVENVPALLFRDMGIVLGELARIGYDAEWERISAAAFGAPIRRRRVWLVAYPAQELRVRSVFSSDGDAEGYRPQFKRVWAMLTARRAGGRPPADFRRLRADDGFSAQLDAIAGYGNAVLPQAAEWIARRILEAEGLIA